MTLKQRAKNTKQDDVQTSPQEAHNVDTSGVDAILDEIDDVLEENAELFVRNYTQKGGE